MVDAKAIAGKPQIEAPRPTADHTPPRQPPTLPQCDPGRRVVITKAAKTRIVHLVEGGEGFDFLGFHHRLVRGRTPDRRT